MEKPLDFYAWLEKVNPKEYKQHLKYKDNKVEYKFITAYKRYLISGLIEPINIQPIGVNMVRKTNKGNTLRKKPMPNFL